jgi:hypothetical protein
MIVNEKIITTILQFGFDCHNGPKLGFISAVQGCIQWQVLGTATKPSQWKLKYSQPANESVQLDNVQFRNETGRKFIKKIDCLIECAVTDEELSRKLIHMISQYTQGMCILTLRTVHLRKRKWIYSKIAWMMSFMHGLKYLVWKE